jgi:hypothetical protein
MERPRRGQLTWSLTKMFRNGCAGGSVLIVLIVLIVRWDLQFLPAVLGFTSLLHIPPPCPVLGVGLLCNR